MALYGIGDLHLSLGAEKPMDIFGGLWKDHQEKLREAFSPLGPEDVCVILGDLSWSMGLENAAADFRFLDELGGRKLLLKGNHDYWWSTGAKVRRFFEQEEIRSVRILHNNCYTYGDLAICGTRGWLKVPAEMQKMYLVSLLCKPQRWPRAHIQHAFVAVHIHYYPSSIYAVLEFLRCVQLQIRGGKPELAAVA